MTVAAKIPTPPIYLLATEDVAVQLADEGVPVRAIARSLRTPTSEVYDVLKEAIESGRIIELPQGEWPPGARRNRGASSGGPLQLDSSALRLACAQVFKLTRLQAAVFVTILRRSEVTKEQVHAAIEAMRNPGLDPTDPKIVDVIIFHIRTKLKKFSITIQTIWGQGYHFEPRDRDRTLALLAAHLDPEPADDLSAA